jgi:hypothetical protein
MINLWPTLCQTLSFRKFWIAFCMGLLICTNFVSGLDSGVCEVCPRDKYCSDRSVTQCPEYSTSRPGSNTSIDCICKAGYSGPNGGPCTACLAGSYKRFLEGKCISCPNNTISDAGSTFCDMCPLGMTRDINDYTKCSCDQGHGLSTDGVCQQCTAGQFKDIVGNVSCILCAQGSFTKYKAESACEICPQNEVTLTEGSSQCVCDSAYSRLNGTCVLCPYGLTKNVIGDQKCECSPGFGYNSSSDSCAICGRNSYKTVSGNTSCIPKDDPGFYFSLRISSTLQQFTETIKPILVEIIAEILNVSSNLVVVLSVQEEGNNMNSRRLLQADSMIAVDFFVKSTKVESSRLTTPEVNSKMLTRPSTANFVVAVQDVIVVVSPVTPVPVIPVTPVPVIPTTPVPVIPGTPVPVIPGTPVPVIPGTPVPVIPGSPVPVIPGTPVPVIPGTPVPVIPGSPVPIIPVMPGTPVDSASSPIGIIVAIVAVVVILAGGGGAFWWYKRKSKIPAVPVAILASKISDISYSQLRTEDFYNLGRHYV